MKRNNSTTKRPDPIELRYGQEQYERGYSSGYKRCSWDSRKRRDAKEQRTMERFNKYVDYLEDSFAANRKK